jgi:hypothetical protein
VSAEILRLPSHADVDAVASRGLIVQARRCDPFDLLHAAVTETAREDAAASPTPSTSPPAA